MLSARNWHGEAIDASAKISPREAINRLDYAISSMIALSAIKNNCSSVNFIQLN